MPLIFIKYITNISQKRAKVLSFSISGVQANIPLFFDSSVYSGVNAANNEKALTARKNTGSEEVGADRNQGKAVKN